MNDQQLCEIVHEATTGSLYPRGYHSGETMAVARAVREACAKVAENWPRDGAEGSEWDACAKGIAAAIRNPE